jgi:cell division septation protein DedD
LAQDDYYYEIQLTNKQLVFYFLAGATLLISSFLLGVMVGRGVDASGGEVLAAKSVREDRIVPEESPKPRASAAGDLGYPQRLAADKPQDDLDTQKPASPAPSPKPVKVVKPSPKPSPAETQAPPVTAPSPKLSPSPAPTLSPKPSDASTASGIFSIQVGAFKDKASADSIVTRLKGKGYAAFVVPTEGNDADLFIVRVGTYPSRTAAEKTERRLRDEEKFKPYIVPQ